MKKRKWKRDMKIILVMLLVILSVLAVRWWVGEREEQQTIEKEYKYQISDKYIDEGIGMCGPVCYYYKYYVLEFSDVDLNDGGLLYGYAKPESWTVNEEEYNSYQKGDIYVITINELIW